jgi:hypothetical protein
MMIGPRTGDRARRPVKPRTRRRTAADFFMIGLNPGLQCLVRDILIRAVVRLKHGGGEVAQQRVEGSSLVQGDRAVRG